MNDKKLAQLIADSHPDKVIEHAAIGEMAYFNRETRTVMIDAVANNRRLVHLRDTFAQLTEMLGAEPVTVERIPVQVGSILRRSLDKPKVRR